VSPDGRVRTLAGTVFPGHVDGQGAEARFHMPDGITADPSGILYITDRGNHAIRRISPAGVVTTIAGGSSAGYADGAAHSARFNGPGVIGTMRPGIDIADTVIIASD